MVANRVIVCPPTSRVEVHAKFCSYVNSAADVYRGKSTIDVRRNIQTAGLRRR